MDEALRKLERSLTDASVDDVVLALSRLCRAYQIEQASFILFRKMSHFSVDEICFIRDKTLNYLLNECGVPLEIALQRWDGIDWSKRGKDALDLSDLQNSSRSSESRVSLTQDWPPAKDDDSIYYPSTDSE